MAFAGLVDAREIASTTRSGVPRAMRPVAMPFPARTLPSGMAAASSGRTTLVPIAMMRLPRSFARAICVAVRSGMRYGSSKGRRKSSAGSPVEETPGECVSVAKLTSRRRQAWSVTPVERKACRWRLERDRPGGNLHPNIPQCQRLGNMRVLDRPAVLRQSCKYRCVVAWEAQLEQARMVEKALYDGFKRAEPEAISW